MTCSGLEAPRITVLVEGLRATQASASWAVLHPSSVTPPMLTNWYGLARGHTTGSGERTLGERRQLLDLRNLLVTLLLIQALERGLEEVGVVGKPRASGDAVIVLRRRLRQAPRQLISTSIVFSPCR